MKAAKVKLNGRGLDILMAILIQPAEGFEDHKAAASLLAEIEQHHKTIVKPVVGDKDASEAAWDGLEQTTCEVMLDMPTREWTLKKLRGLQGISMTLSRYVLQLNDALKNAEEVEVKPCK